MKEQVFEQALGMIINKLTHYITSGFTIKKVGLSTIIYFTYNLSNQSIEIQDNKTERMMIFLNSICIGNCIDIDITICNIKKWLI